MGSASATMRAVRAAFSTAPDPLLIDAMSDSGGEDTAAKVADATLEAMEAAAVARWARYGGE